MLILSSIKRDLTVEDEGAWIDIPEWPGVKFKVRSINSKSYMIARDMLVQSLTRKLGRIPTGAEMEPSLGRLIATHLLRGWEGIADDDKKPIEYTPQVGIEYLTNEELRELEHQVVWAATRVGDRDAEFTVAAIKNSGAPLPTS